MAACAVRVMRATIAGIVGLLAGREHTEGP